MINKLNFKKYNIIINLVSAIVLTIFASFEVNFLIAVIIVGTLNSLANIIWVKYFDK